jgi:hypothetical protein
MKMAAYCERKGLVISFDSSMVFLRWLLFFFCLPGSVSFAQSPNQIINTVNSRFAKVNDYQADVTISCNIPFIIIEPITAKVFYKKPDKFKVKSTGILILPKQQANFLLKALADTNSYTAVKTGEELINKVSTSVISIIPHTDTDLVLGKFWIYAEKGLILKSQLTTKSQGTILVEESYGAQASFGLPDQMIFTVETGKFKIPKALAADLNRPSNQNTTTNNTTGTIILDFANYIVNKGVSDEIFREQE